MTPSSLERCLFLSHNRAYCRVLRLGKTHAYLQALTERIASPQCQQGHHLLPLRAGQKISGSLEGSLSGVLNSLLGSCASYYIRHCRRSVNVTRATAQVSRISTTTCPLVNNLIGIIYICDAIRGCWTNARSRNPGGYPRLTGVSWIRYTIFTWLVAISHRE